MSKGAVLFRCNGKVYLTINKVRLPIFLKLAFFFLQRFDSLRITGIDVLIEEVPEEVQGADVEGERNSFQRVVPVDTSGNGNVSSACQTAFGHNISD